MSSTQSPVAELRALSDLIKSSVDKIEALCVERESTYPSIDTPFSPQSDVPRMMPDVIEEGVIIVAAAAQLIAAVRPPPVGMIGQAFQFHVSSCLRAAIQLHVPEILRDAGPKGLHVTDIAAPTQADPGKLARVLRVLATKHIFREISPDVFANNRLSSVLDTHKKVSDILANPEAKHDNTPGIAALLEHVTDTGFKSSAYLSEALQDPEFSRSGEPNKTALNMAFNTSLTSFEWEALPENSYRRKLLSIGMAGVQNVAASVAVLEGFEWKDLPANSVVVDVGGGIGSQAMVLAQSFDHLKFIVQDRKEAIEDAKKYWDSNMPDAVTSGRVELQEYDFLTQQPVREPAVFFLRMILHDWSDKYCVQILKNLRAAAGAQTVLVVNDNIISYASPDAEYVKRIPGAETTPPPEPLLSNKGEANVMAYLADMQMLTSLNGSERTVRHYDNLFGASGWSLSRVFINKGFQSQSSKIVGVPA